MKLSLITATYNSADVLGDCLDSVSLQDYDNIEHLVVDGNSSDDTLRVVKSFQGQHRHIKVISEPDKGIYDALNKGISLATGDVLGFLHSDDKLASPRIITQIMDHFIQSDSDGVYGNLDYVDRKNGAKIIRSWKSRDFDLKLLRRGWMPAHPTLFLRKEVYRKHGNFNLNYKIAADYDLMLRVLKDSSLRFTFVPQVVTKMRVGGESNRSLKNVIQKSREDYRVLRSNHIPTPLWALFLKNISKIPQFFRNKQIKELRST